MARSGTECRVSILILTYNHEEFIEACIRSVINTDFPDFHVWVLDDGSTDRTHARALKAAEGRSDITILTQANNGGRTAENSQRLIDMSRGEYILFMSGDDLLGPDFRLAAAVEVMENQSRVAMFLPRMVYLMQDPARAGSPSFTSDLLQLLRSGDPSAVLQKHLYQKVSRIFLQGMVVRRSCVEAFGGFDRESFADDYAFMLRLFLYLADKGLSFVFNEESLWLYRIHDRNIHGSALRHFQLILDVVSKYVPPPLQSEFSWDRMAFTKVEDYGAARRYAEERLSPTNARRLLRPIERLTVRAARRRKDRRVLGQLALGAGMSLTLRLNALAALFYLLVQRLFVRGPNFDK